MTALPFPSGGSTATPSLGALHHASLRDMGSAVLPAPCLSDREGSGSRGEGVALSLSLETENEADVAARDALLDRAMGPRWKKKSSHRLRRGRLPAEGLAFVARDADGAVVGTVRLWDVAVGSRPISPLVGEMSPKATEGGAVPPPSQSANDEGVRSFALPSALPGISPTRGEIGSGAVAALLLGPLAVDPRHKSSGIGSALMRHAIAEAKRLGHKAILLVGDAAYYGRFGFSAAKTGRLAMPGPYERHRFLALELVPGALDGAQGVLAPTGRKAKPAVVAKTG